MGALHGEGAGPSRPQRRRRAGNRSQTAGAGRGVLDQGRPGLRRHGNGHPPRDATPDPRSQPRRDGYACGDRSPGPDRADARPPGREAARPPRPGAEGDPAALDASLKRPPGRATWMRADAAIGQRVPRSIHTVSPCAGHPRLPSTVREYLKALLDYHRAETAARGAVHDYLAAAERHVKACEPLRREAERGGVRRGVHVAEVAGWPEWRQGARLLEKAGRAILADEDIYGAYLDALAAGKPRVRLTAPRPVVQPHRGRKRPDDKSGESRGSPRAGARAAGRLRPHPRRSREAQAAAGAIREARAQARRHMRRSRGLSMWRRPAPAAAEARVCAGART